MTISSDTRTAGPFTGTGAVSTYAFAFKVFASSEVVATSTNTSGALTTLTQPTDYTVTLNGNQNTSPGGTITLVAPLASGYVLEIGSEIAATQGASLPNQGGWYPSVIEDALDRLTILAQQMGGGNSDRNLRVPELGGVADLPSAADRAGKLLSFDAVTGAPEAVAPVDGTATALALDLASTTSGKGADLIGVNGSTDTAGAKLQRLLLATDTGAAGNGVADDTPELATLVSGSKFAVPGGWLTYAVTDTAARGALKEAKLLKDGAIEMPNILPSYFGNARAAKYYGGQLKALMSRLADPFTQSVNVAFIGDSITWGVGATGSAVSTPRDQTLSDPRDYYKTGSYVNNVKRYIKKLLGNGVSEALSNHPASPSGESIVTYTKALTVYPIGQAFTAVLTGSVTDTQIADVAALHNSKRAFAVNPGSGNKTLIRFTFTGGSIEIVFGALVNGAKYNLRVNGVQIGGTSYSTRVGDDGLTAGYSRSRVHTFARVIDAVVEFETVHYDNISGVNAIYLEALRWTKTVRVKNQGLSGTTGKAYLTYSFPTARETGATYFRPGAYTGLTETPTGTTSVTDRDAIGSITGAQRLYGMAPTGSGWDIDFPVNAAKPFLNIAYSSTAGGSDVEVRVAGTVIDTFSSNSNAPGGSAGYGKIRTVTLPGGTASVKIRLVVANYGGGAAYINYLYLEGLANYATADLSYPTTSTFGDGVALAQDDDFAFIQLGTNDRIAADSAIENPQSMVDYLERILNLTPITTKCVLMVANPALADTAPTYAYGMREVANNLERLAERKALDFVNNFHIFEDAPSYAYTSDGLHPNDLGHKLIAANIIAAMVNAK